MAYRMGVVAVLALAGTAGGQVRQASQLEIDQSYEKVIYFSGQVRLDDSSPPPEPVAINRICNGQSHFETWTDAKGRFTFQVGAHGKDAAQGDASQNSGPPPDLMRSISVSTQDTMPVTAALRDCELEAVLAGYRSDLISIAVKSRLDDTRLGVIMLHPLSRATALTVSATTLQAPANARKAYDKAIDALADKKWQVAVANLTKAVTAYPKFAIAWYQLGLLRQRRNDAAGAIDAWKHALASDPKYIKPYENLTVMADHAQDWEASEEYSRRWIDLDPEDFPAAYLYNAIANARLNRTDVAERAVREGLRLDKDRRIPRLSFVLALILAGKNENTESAKYFREYLALAPNAKDAAGVRQELSRLDAAAAPPQ